ncbi:hypothetical protein, partial [Legionella sp. 29fVS95]|uniref:hypothetical protein n=1 Tax=Legionella sp. 29fVS95 TaxID=3402813 RepID=UPI003AF4D64F
QYKTPELASEHALRISNLLQLPPIAAVLPEDDATPPTPVAIRSVDRTKPAIFFIVLPAY